MISERELRRMATTRDATVILEDTECRRCSYNLKGLKRGGSCPECGTPISSAGGGIARDSSLVTAPPEYLRGLAWAARVMVLAHVVGPVSVIVALHVLPERAAASLGVMWSVLWLASIWWLARPRRPGDGDTVPKDEDRIKVIVLRAMQVTWMLACVVWLLNAMTVLPNSAGLIALLMAIGHFSSWFVFLRAASIAEAASDPDFARMLRQSVLFLLLVLPGAGVVTLLLWMISVLIWAPIPRNILTSIGVCTLFLPGAYYTWRVASLANWALRISVERDARDARMIQRAKQASQSLRGK